MSINYSDILQSRLDAVLTGSEEMGLSLYDENGHLIGMMRPLTANHLDQSDVISKLTDWRNANMANFLTSFEATTVRTRSWLKNVLLQSRGQMLWLVYDQNGFLVGHFGFKNLTSENVLLDNAMRGERRGHPKLLVSAGKTLVQWIWQETSAQRIEAYVMADNAPSIMMNRQIGFQGWKRHPLIKRIIEGDTHWDIGEKGEKSPDSRYCFTLFIQRNLDEKTIE
jgi:RimJ/RimL family protein N-acetyltransferase